MGVTYSKSGAARRWLEMSHALLLNSVVLLITYCNGILFGWATELTGRCLMMVIMEVTKSDV